MKNMITLATLSLLAPLYAHAADTALFHLAVKDVPVENGKILDMEFQETAREPGSSSIVITRRSGGSVSTSMFILRGMCGVARARGKQNFVPVRSAGEVERYTLTFPDEPPSDHKGFTMMQCDLMRF